MNVYRYVVKCPVVYSDPSGLAWQQEGESTIWIADADGDTLEQLAVLVTMEARDWVCIWPCPGKGLWDNYPVAKQGAKADVKNLTATEGKILTMAPAVTVADDDYMHALRIVAPPDYQWPNGRQAALKFKSVSGQGKRPLSVLLIEGHHFGNDLSLRDGRVQNPFAAADVIAVADEPNNATNTLAHAVQQIGPPRCWLIREGRVFLASCTTEIVADNWANTVVRVTASAFGTPALMEGEWRQTGRGPSNRTAAVWIVSDPDNRATNRNELLALPAWVRSEGTQ